MNRRQLLHSMLGAAAATTLPAKAAKALPVGELYERKQQRLLRFMKEIQKPSGLQEVLINPANLDALR